MHFSKIYEVQFTTNSSLLNHYKLTKLETNYELKSMYFRTDKQANTASEFYT